MQISGNTMLITGGGSGIGAALAHRFHDLGNKVIIAGRTSEQLERAANGRNNVHPITVDVDSHVAVQEFAIRVLEQHPELNILINNAGIMRYEPIDKSRDLADAEAMIRTNLLGLISMTDAFVDHLAGRPGATIVNVSSGLAFVPIADAAVYSATKAAVHSYTASLREALKGNVEVIELAPPAVQTELTPGQSQVEGYQPLDEFADEVVQLFSQNVTPAEILVERVKFLRFAEQHGVFDQTFDQLNHFVREARAA